MSPFCFIVNGRRYDRREDIPPQVRVLLREESAGHIPPTHELVEAWSPSTRRSPWLIVQAVLAGVIATLLGWRFWIG